MAFSGNLLRQFLPCCRLTTRTVSRPQRPYDDQRNDCREQKNMLAAEATLKPPVQQQQQASSSESSSEARRFIQHQALPISSRYSLDFNDHGVWRRSKRKDEYEMVSMDGKRSTSSGASSLPAATTDKAKRNLFVPPCVHYKHPQSTGNKCNSV